MANYRHGEGGFLPTPGFAPYVNRMANNFVPRQSSVQRTRPQAPQYMPSLIGKRKTIGGRGREWAHECYKLLEAMFELDESKPFRNPVDVVKYPDYYSIVSKPMDLSKVMVKLHTGKYDSPREIGQDIRQIFDNWKAYNKNPKSQIYMQTHNLSWWFEREFARIIEEWDLMRAKRSRLSSEWVPALRPGVQLAASRPPSSTSSVASHPSKDSESSSTADSSHSERLGSNHKGLMSIMQNMSKQLEALGSPPGVYQLPGSQQNTSIVVSIKNGTCTIHQRAKQQGDKVETESGSHQRSYSAPAPAEEGRLGTHAAPHSAGGAQRSKGASQSSSTSSASRSSAVGNGATQVELETTNIWFGPCRNRSIQPVVLSEDGFRFTLRTEDADVPFRVRPEEIVRCLGHLGKTKKHTIFLFITPACEKRLKEVFREKQLYEQSSRGVPKDEPCSLVALFVKRLHAPQISRLLHAFWIMGKKSIFGQLFSEVDQRGALAILANIKPHILDRVAERAKEATEDAPSSQNQRHSQENDDEDHHENVAQETRQVVPDTFPALRQWNGTDSEPNHTPDGNDDSDTPNRDISWANSSSIPEPVLRVSPVRTSSTSPSATFVPESPIPPVPLLPRAVTALSGAEISKPVSPSSEDGEDPEISESETAADPVQEDEDLEIIIPSDSDDELTYVGRSGSQENAGEDLVMTHARISTKCPITQQVMKCPVRNIHCGHSYDRQGVQQLINNRAEKARCPVPGCSNPQPLKMIEMVYDDNLHRFILSKSK